MAGTPSELKLEGWNNGTGNTGIMEDWKNGIMGETKLPVAAMPNEG
jgi:hypothetical protein